MSREQKFRDRNNYLPELHIEYMAISVSVPISFVVILVVFFSSLTIIVAVLRQFVRDAIAVRNEFKTALEDKKLTLEEAEKILSKIDVLVQNLNAGILKILYLRK